MDDLEDEWIGKVESLQWKLEEMVKDRSIIVPSALIDDHTGEDRLILVLTVPSEEIPPTSVENPMTGLIDFVPTSTPSDDPTRTEFPIMRDDVRGL
ncbi:hypothetical protein Dimus_010773, partial [Dionaea muscipula]